MSAPTSAGPAAQGNGLQPPAFGRPSLAMSDTYAVLYDPAGLIEAELPLDRAPHEALVTAVLAWMNPDLSPRDYEQHAHYLGVLANRRH